MFSIPFVLNPPLTEGKWPWALPSGFLYRQHLHLEVSKELLHCAYFALLFIEGSAKWYVWTALPLLVITILVTLSMRSD